MKVVVIGLKGFQKDSGLYSWTPDVQLEADPFDNTLSDKQKADIAAGLEELKQIEQAAIEKWRAEDFARREASVPAADQPKAAGQQQIYPHDPSGKFPDGYNPTSRCWDACPKCGSKKITHEKKNGEGTWQGCKDCNIGLRRDASTYELGKF